MTPRRPRPVGATAALLLASVALLPRCACDSVPGDALEDCEASQVVPGAVATDILFVIDDSGSMAQEQTNLQNALANFIQALDAAPVANDFQIGVTTTSVAEFDGVPEPPAGDLVPPGVMRAADADLVSAFQGAVVVGTAGSTREQAFEAARLALVKSEAGGPNEGFLRPGARLAVFFLSDEDDCSGPRDQGATPLTDSAGCRAEKVDPASTLLPVGDVASFLSGPIAGEYRDVVVAAVVGVAPATLGPSCGFTYCADRTCSTALDKGDRYLELLAAVGSTRTIAASICDADFGQALVDFASLIAANQMMPLEGAPADPRMLVVSVSRPGVGTIPCRVSDIGAPPEAQAAADVIYAPPQAGARAVLRFQESCELERGDQVDVQVVCAR